ncbi:uncharacterized protein L201_005881 [Kwoniella dendrophila CBS 6074]|uniref:HpcH/HpaI aldolase/citrate lyase domain-containing protein n=1 Tax=Kwoniella dendrophila CBS 6074 TaxID=1295534 RepID=A0AAX4K2H6_9TREE
MAGVDEQTLKASQDKLRLFSKLKKGEDVFGTFQFLGTAWTSRIIAAAGWDYVIVDCEHGNIGDNDMHDSVNAIAAAGVSPIVRIRGTDAALIKRALDTGAHALMVPLVNTAAEAAAVVNAAKFPPMGIRGQGSPFSATAHGIPTPTYLQTANKNILTIIQIESQEGLKNVEEIAAVPGVDAIFIGPNDLSMSLQYYAPPKWDEPIFLEAIDKIHAAVKKHNLPIGILYPDGAFAAKFQKDRHFDIVTVGGDVKALTGWMTTQLSAAKSG